jgi:hypothetical protein
LAGVDMRPRKERRGGDGVLGHMLTREDEKEKKKGVVAAAMRRPL